MIDPFKSCYTCPVHVFSDPSVSESEKGETMKKKTIVICAGLLLIICLFAVGQGWGRFLYLYTMPSAGGAYFDSDGVRIHYREEGNGSPLILVHGLGVNSDINFQARGVTGRLAKEFHLILPDLRGHGRSDKPHDVEAYGVEMCKDIIRLMDHLHIDKAQVLGYSLGGFVVLKLVSLYPERFVSYAPCGAGWTPDSEKELSFAFELASEIEAGKGYGALSDYLTPIGGKVSKQKRTMMSLGLRMINDEQAIAAVLRSMPALAVSEEELTGIELPGLAVIGERDPFRVFTQKLADALPSIRMEIIPGTDHMSTLKSPDAQEVIASFFKAQEGALFQEPAQHEPAR